MKMTYENKDIYCIIEINNGKENSNEILYWN